MAFGLDGEVVLEGSWLYAGTTRYRIAIVRRGSRYGSGDYEDPPEVAQDREAATFEVWYTAAGDPERFAAGGGNTLRLMLHARARKPLAARRCAGRLAQAIVTLSVDDGSHA
jgi:hypothetical protein